MAGQAFTIAKKTKTIASSDLDSIYSRNLNDSFIKENEVFEVENFNKERERLVNLFRDNGIENFQQKSIRFKVYLDSLGKDFEIPVDIVIQNEAKRDQNNIVEVPYVIQKVNEVKLYIENPNKDFSI